MLKPVDNYFLNKDEPLKSYLQFLRGYIISFAPGITETWKYQMPFYCFNTKRFCYLWIHKKFMHPYIGFVDGNKINHPDLLTEKRSRMKILLLDPNRPVPKKKINLLLKQAIKLCS